MPADKPASGLRALMVFDEQEADGVYEEFTEEWMEREVTGNT